MDPNPKQQVSEQLKNAKSVLVTTSNNPSVDDVTSVMGLTHLLQAMKKHASAVVSSSTPSALKFLNPDDIIETSTDKLRDFVVSFDKEKADKLRYKVEDDQVKIFITPYKTVISKDDFHFTQGDFHVDTIVVIGATKREELDPAVLKHGRILHDAEVITINAGAGHQTNMGSINWHEESASSVSELLVSISEALGSGLLDKNSAQVLLTGLVAATDMFSNTVTSPKVMTMAAQLMAAGADQQQIMKELKAGEEISKHAQELQAQQHEEQQNIPPVTEKPPKAQNSEDDVMLDLGTNRQDEPTKSPEVAQPQLNEAPRTAEVQPPQPQSSQQAPKDVKTEVSVHESTQRSNKHKLLTDSKRSSTHGALEHHTESLGSKKTSATSKNTTTPSSASPKPSAPSSPAAQKPQPSQTSSTLPEPPAPESKPEPKSASTAHVSASPELPSLSNAPQEQAESTPTKESVPSAAKAQPEDGQGKKQAEDSESAAELEAARKAVQDAIANQPSPLPSSDQSLNSKEVTEDGGDIQIDHDGNVQLS